MFLEEVKSNFIKLSVAMATLVLITSSSLYIYIKIKSDHDMRENLQLQANYLVKNFYNQPEALKEQKRILNSLNIEY